MSKKGKPIWPFVITQLLEPLQEKETSEVVKSEDIVTTREASSSLCFSSISFRESFD